MKSTCPRQTCHPISDSTAEFRIISEDQEDPAFRQTMDAGLARAKAITKAKKKAKRNSFATWLRKRISRLNYGKAWHPGTKPTPQLDAEALMKLYRRKRCGASINSEQYQRHFDLLDTLYFWADHRTATAEILVMIDIDVHDGIKHQRRGSGGSAELVKILFPGIHLEPSTNGEGVHGYLVISKEGQRTLGGVSNTPLHNLQAYLQELHRFVGADISCVEVKGGPPDVKYDDLTDDITEIDFGQLAKIPRDKAVMNTYAARIQRTRLSGCGGHPGEIRQLGCA